MGSENVKYNFRLCCVRNDSEQAASAACLRARLAWLSEAIRQAPGTPRMIYLDPAVASNCRIHPGVAQDPPCSWTQLQGWIPYTLFTPPIPPSLRPIYTSLDEGCDFTPDGV